jgi:Subtilase family/Dockerin type I domain
MHFTKLRNICVFSIIVLLFLPCSWLMANNCEHDAEIIIKIADGVINWPSNTNQNLLENVDFNSSSLHNILSNYGNPLIERLFDDQTTGQILIENPAGLITTKPSFYNQYKIYMDDTLDTIQLLIDLDDEDGIIYAFRNSCITNQSTPVNDPRYSEQWALKNTGQFGGVAGFDINIEGAWEYTTGSNSTVVAVVDRFIDRNHIDLTGRISGNIGSGSDPHGMNVAGVIGANTNNSEGIAGVDRQSRLLSMYVPDGYSSTDYYANKIMEAIDSGSHIINLSHSHYGDHQNEISTLRYAYNMNQFVSAPAGNDPNQINPAGYPNVFAVAAYLNHGHHAPYSNTGSWIDVAAPGSHNLGEGTAILTTTFSGGYTNDFGQTSAATAHVTGVAALLKSYNPDLWNDDIANILRITVRESGPLGWDSAYGWGEIDAEAAIEMIAMPNIVLQDVAVNGYTHSVSSGLSAFAFFGIPGLGDGVYYAKIHEIRKDVIFQNEFESVLGAWGRGAASNGYELNNPHYGWFFSGVVDGSITNTGMTVYTHVFELWDFNTDYVGFKPCSPSEATMAYTVVGSPSCYGICGDANNDGTVNTSDAIHVINYVLIGGPPPEPVLACGEANSDETVNISDAVWIINYVYVGGAPPGVCSPEAFPGASCCPFVPSP